MRRKSREFNQDPGQQSFIDKQQRDSSAWPHPFTDAYGGELTKKHWCIVIVVFIILHLLALQASRFVGCFMPDPGHDYINGMRQVLERGHPGPMRLPPGFSYYLAFKWIITQTLGLPYWSAKYFIDIFFVILSGILSIILGSALTKNRFLAMVSGLGLVCAPIYILGAAIEEAAIFFLPFFLFSLLLLVKELQRKRGPRILYFFISGAIMGIACLIRANPQFIFIVIAPFTFWALRKASVSRWQLRAATILFAFFLGQVLVVSPQSFAKAGISSGGVTNYPIRNYFWGIKRQTGNRIGDWLREHYEEPERSLKGVVDFNLTWLKKDPAAFFELYLLKFVRAWYISESGQWDKPILIVHFPYWVFALLGLRHWWRRKRTDPAYVFILAIILYMWVISGIAGGVARQTNFIYGFVSILGGAFLLPHIRRF